MVEPGQYDYELPRDMIAQSPAPRRVDARLMVVDRKRNSLKHKHIRDLPELLEPNDCLVLNDTRVVPARLVGRRTQTGGHWEGLFLEVGENGFWRILCKTRGKLTPGETITLTDTEGRENTLLRLEAKQPDGTWVVQPEPMDEVFKLLDRVGRVPLPPYIRGGNMIESDRDRYQTVFAESPGAIAAPTAGLHFTEPLLHRLENQGMTICRLTLHVGHGTFQPITTDSLSEHKMHAEWGSIGLECVEQIAECRRGGGRIIAVGSTAVRLLETASAGGTLEPFTGRTDLFIRPPYEFRTVDAMLTNFHLPRTTLLVLVRTFGGEELMRRAYEEAIREEYRFYSYGDAMLIF